MPPFQGAGLEFGSGWTGELGRPTWRGKPVPTSRCASTRRTRRARVSTLAAVPEPLLLTGDDLTLDDVWDVAVHGREARLSDLAIERLKRARALVEEQQDEHYGVNTGFGRFVSESIPADQVDELQLRLLRSHACVGEPYPADVTRAAMLLRANALAKGSRVRAFRRWSCCSTSWVAVSCRACRRVAPSARAATSPLAHLALPLVGEGEAWFGDELLSGADALARAGLVPIRLAPKKVSL